MSDLVRAPEAEGLSDQVLDLVRASRAAKTLAAYAGDWRRFAAWCVEHGRASTPASPSTLAEYLGDLARRGQRPSTIERARRHRPGARAAGAAVAGEGPAHLRVMKGVRRTLGVAQKEARPLTVDELRLVVEKQPNNEMGIATALCLLRSFIGALRRSVVALDVVERRGHIVTVKKSKTDQEGRVPALRGQGERSHALTWL